MRRLKISTSATEISSVNDQPAYHEALLHWIWEQQQFDPRLLETNEGQPIQVHDTGRLNKSDGPDFEAAELTIGPLRWYGDVELHWQINDWKHHGHHKDPNFNNVVLHVVFAEAEGQIHREDHSSIPTLCLEPLLSQSLRAFMEQYQNKPELPCAGQLSFISEEAFKKQLEKAHKEYFEQKVDDLLEYYDPSLPPSRSWTRMLGIALSDGLGISHNRRPMRKLAVKLIGQSPNVTSKNELRHKAVVLSGLSNNGPSSLSLKWNHKGCRPGNHPRVRIKQAADLLWHILRLPFEQWLKDNPKLLWQNLLQSVTTKPSVGQERGSILFGTVFLPALYSLGNLFFSAKLKSQSWQLWRNHQANLPSSLLQLLNNTELPRSLYAQKLGTIYQLRAYCRPRNCQDCKVFKNAISS